MVGSRWWVLFHKKLWHFSFRKTRIISYGHLVLFGLVGMWGWGVRLDVGGRGWGWVLEVGEIGEGGKFTHEIT